MANRILGAAAALAGLTGVGLGAAGAHALQAQLAAGGHLDTWHTAVLYQLVHAATAAGVAMADRWACPPRGHRWLRAAGWAWLVGVLLFSGSLYALALGGPRWLGPVTPLGGLALLAGWSLLLVGFCRSDRPAAGG